jgi:hypothetical protein
VIYKGVYDCYYLKSRIFGRFVTVDLEPAIQEGDSQLLNPEGGV